MTSLQETVLQCMNDLASFKSWIEKVPKGGQWFLAVDYVLKDEHGQDDLYVYTLRSYEASHDGYEKVTDHMLRNPFHKVGDIREDHGEFLGDPHFFHLGFMVKSTGSRSQERCFFMDWLEAALTGKYQNSDSYRNALCQLQRADDALSFKRLWFYCLFAGVILAQLEKAGDPHLAVFGPDRSDFLYSGDRLGGDILSHLLRDFETALNHKLKMYYLNVRSHENTNAWMDVNMRVVQYITGLLAAHNFESQQDGGLTAPPITLMDKLRSNQNLCLYRLDFNKNHPELSIIHT